MRALSKTHNAGTQQNTQCGHSAKHTMRALSKSVWIQIKYSMSVMSDRHSLNRSMLSLVGEGEDIVMHTCTNATSLCPSAYMSESLMSVNASS